MSAQGETQPLASDNRTYDNSIVPFFSIDYERLKAILLRSTAREGDSTICALLPPQQWRPRARGYTTCIDAFVVINAAGRIERKAPASAEELFAECDEEMSRLLSYVMIHLAAVSNHLRKMARENALPTRDPLTSELRPANSIVDPPLCAANPQLPVQEEHACPPSGPMTSGHQTNTRLVALVLADLTTTKRTPQQWAKIHRRLSHLGEVVTSLKESLVLNHASLEVLANLYDERSVTHLGQDFLRRSEKVLTPLLEDVEGMVQGMQSLIHEANEQEILSRSDVEKNAREMIILRIREEKLIECSTVLQFLLLLVVWGICIFMYYWDSTQTWVIIYRLSRSILLTILYLYLVALYIRVWAGAKIDFIQVFGIHLDRVPTPKYFVNIAGLFTIIFGGLISLELVLNEYIYHFIPVKIFPLIMWVILLVFLINPFNVYNRRARFSFIIALFRVATAPFHPVHFSDLFLTANLNGIVIILLDIEYMACYVIEGPWSGLENINTCISTENAVRPIVALIPTLWSWMLCLRAFYDLRSPSFIFIAMKGVLTIPVIVFATIVAAKLPPPNSMTESSIGSVFRHWGYDVILWLLFAAIQATYVYFRDFRSEWGLLRISQGTILRPVLLYPLKAIYYFALTTKWFLQFLWIIDLANQVLWKQRSDIFYTAFAIAGIVSQFQWNLFRLEWEWVRLNYNVIEV